MTTNGAPLTVDRDKDGCLSAVELKEGLHGVGIKINSRDFGLLLKDIDISVRESVFGKEGSINDGDAIPYKDTREACLAMIKLQNLLFFVGVYV